MKIFDFNTNVETENESDLKYFLSKRFGNGVNAFWLQYDNESAFPTLSILVNGTLTSLTYFPKQHHPGFRSVGNTNCSDANETSAFFLNESGEKLEVINESIVSYSSAIAAACQFMHCKDMPSCIEWEEM